MCFISRFLFCLFFVLIALFSSCHSQKQIVPKDKNYINKNIDLVKKNTAYEEMRRLNFKIDLNEITILKDFQSTLELYQKLDDSKYSKSFPIPSLQHNENLIVLKPKLMKVKFGDIKISKIENNGEILTIEYEEVENLEYQQNKWSNPILIIKVVDNFKKIQLNFK